MATARNVLRLENLARELKIAERVRFLGRKSRREVAAAMRRCTVFALPSRYEGLGCVYLEAMSVGKPVIGCRGQGIAEIIQHGSNGFLVGPDNEKELTLALAMLLRDEARRRNLGAAARDTILERFTLGTAGGKSGANLPGVPRREAPPGPSHGDYFSLSHSAVQCSCPAYEGVDLHVIFLAETDPDLRSGRFTRTKSEFSYEVLPSWRKRVGRYKWLLNRGVGRALTAVAPDVVLCGGYNYVASWQALALGATTQLSRFFFGRRVNLQDIRRGASSGGIHEG